MRKTSGQQGKTRNVCSKVGACWGFYNKRMSRPRRHPRQDVQQGRNWQNKYPGFFCSKRDRRSERGLFLASVGFRTFEFSRPYPGEWGGLACFNKRTWNFLLISEIREGLAPMGLSTWPATRWCRRKKLNGDDSQDHWKWDDTVIPRPRGLTKHLCTQEGLNGVLAFTVNG